MINQLYFSISVDINLQSGFCLFIHISSLLKIITFIIKKIISARKWFNSLIFEIIYLIPLIYFNVKYFRVFDLTGLTIII